MTIPVHLPVSVTMNTELVMPNGSAVTPVPGVPLKITKTDIVLLMQVEYEGVLVQQWVTRHTVL